MASKNNEIHDFYRHIREYVYIYNIEGQIYDVRCQLLANDKNYVCDFCFPWDTISVGINQSNTHAGSGIMTDRLFSFNLLHAKVDSSRLLERISLRVSFIFEFIPDHESHPSIPASRSIFLMNDPLVKPMQRFINNNDVDICP